VVANAHAELVRYQDSNSLIRCPAKLAIAVDGSSYDMSITANALAELARLWDTN